MSNMRKWLAKSFPHKKIYIGIVVIFLGLPYLVMLLFWFLNWESERLNRDTWVLDFEKNKVIYMKLLECYKITRDVKWCEKEAELKEVHLSVLETTDLCGSLIKNITKVNYFTLGKWISYKTDNYYFYPLENNSKSSVYWIWSKSEIIDLWEGWFACLRKR